MFVVSALAARLFISPQQLKEIIIGSTFLAPNAIVSFNSLSETTAISLIRKPILGRYTASRSSVVERPLGTSRMDGLFKTQRNLRKYLLDMQRNLHECWYCSLLFFFRRMRILERESVT